ncbi:MAG: hypothetical protein AAF682_17700 [Planctomycetota bacterium]
MSLPRLALLLALAAPAALLSAVPAEAQQQQQGRNARNAAPQEPSPLARLDIGPKAVLLNHHEEHVGWIGDYVIDAASGRVLFCVVNIPSHPSRVRPVLVPYRALHYSERRALLTLPVPLTEVQELPDFEPARVQQLSDRERSTPVEARAASQEKKAREAGTAPANLLASEMIGKPIVAGDVAVGVVGRLVLDPKEGAVPYVFAKPTKLEPEAPILPWTALKRDPAGRFATRKSAKEMEKAPRMANIRALEQPALRKQIRAFYNANKKKPSGNKAKGGKAKKNNNKKKEPKQNGEG